MPTSPAITIRSVSKAFGTRPRSIVTALQNINLTIQRGEIFVFIGPSGCGKSTLLRLMCGLEYPSSGQVNLGDGLQRSDISFVFQQFALLPWLTVAENVALGLRARQVPAHDREQRIHEELTVFGLEKFANAYPEELSGGMQQRVGIARALATNPKIILMDEAFSELDSFTAQELRQELLTIWEKQHPTIILVTHIIEEALLLADRIAVLTPRPGQIKKIVENTLPHPRQERSRPFYILEDQLYDLIKP